MALLDVKKLTKNFGGLTAVSDVTLELNEGELVGLIGPNGAGKTTLFNLLTGVYEPSEGTVTLDGHLLNGKTPYKIATLGLSRTFQNIRLFKDLTVLDNVLIAFGNHHKPHVLASFFRLPAFYKNEEELKAKALELLAIFDFASHRYEVIESFSHGMRQKVFVIGALLSDPDIWVLDEPLTGLDPQAAFDLKQMMREHADKGNTVLFSTHVLEVAEQLCDKIAILKKGELIFYGTVEDLKAQHPDQSLETIYLGLAGRREEVSSDAP